MIDISVVVPVFQGAPFIEESLRTLSSFLAGSRYEFEIIVVDDGSRDGTAEKLASLSLPCLSVQTLPANRGKYFAIRTGMGKASGRCKVFIDADLPVDLSIIPYMASCVLDRGVHIVVGDRTLTHSLYERQTPIGRQVSSSLFSLFVRALVAGGLYDTQCGIKAFRGDVAACLFPLLREDRFAGDVELLYVALKYNFEIKRVPVLLRNAQEHSTVSVWRQAPRMIWRLLRLPLDWRRKIYYSNEANLLSQQIYWK